MASASRGPTLKSSTLGEQLKLGHNHRLIGPDGTIYQVVEFSQAERIDALPMAVVTRVGAE